MPAPRKYDQETRDRAVRMFLERRGAHPGESAIESGRQPNRGMAGQGGREHNHCEIYWVSHR